MMRIFNETQKFTQWWLKLLNLFILGLVVYAFYNWFILKEAVGNVPENDLAGQLAFSSILFFSIGIIYLFRLKTSIDEIGIHYQFSPINLSKKTIRWSEIKNCYVRTYSPLKEYGGWGYRMSFGNGKALNVKGNIGVQIELKTGKKLLIGTQEEEDAQKVIERYFKTSDE
ncbi:MAG: hypothetical protein AB8B59_09985 [Maribacter sp.]